MRRNLVIVVALVSAVHGTAFAKMVWTCWNEMSKFVGSGYDPKEILKGQAGTCIGVDFGTDAPHTEMKFGGTEGPKPTGDAPERAPGPAGGDPVLGDGEFIQSSTDLEFPGFGLRYEFKRTYRSRMAYLGPLGHGWDHNYNRRLVGPGCDGSVDYLDGALQRIHFVLATDDGQVTKYAAPQGVALRLERRKADVLPWILEEGGVVSRFSGDGRLAEMEDLAHDKMIFEWEKVPIPNPGPEGSPYPRRNEIRLRKVTDTTKRIVWYNYDGEFLRCLNLVSDCVAPLISFQIMHSAPTAPDHGLLLSVLDALGNGPRYEYTVGHASKDWIPAAEIDGFCNRACGPTELDCRNFDLCKKSLAHCERIVDYFSCVDHCRPSCAHFRRHCDGYLGPCRDFHGETQCWAYSDCVTDCDSMCGLGCLPVGGGGYGWEFYRATCSQPILEVFPFCAPGQDCGAGCRAHYRAVDGFGKTRHAFGQPGDLNHNLVAIYDADNRLVLRNTYGTDPFDVSFDKVVDQLAGQDDLPENHIKFEHHDLRVEKSPPAGETPSVPNAIDVESIDTFTSVDVCPLRCERADPTTGQCARWGYNEATTDRDAPSPQQVPAFAVVVYDLHGVKRTQYYDAKWNLVRERNQTTGETTDFAFSDGYFVGEREPSGARLCLRRDAFGRILQRTRLSAPNATVRPAPVVTTYKYGDGIEAHPDLLVEEIVDRYGESTAWTAYKWDTAGRLSWIERDIDGAVRLKTSYGYGSGSYPTSQTGPGGEVASFAYDPVAAAPTTVTIGFGESSPLVYTTTYDAFGRVKETGRLSGYRERFEYTAVGLAWKIDRRKNDLSSWETTTVLHNASRQAWALFPPRLARYVSHDSVHGVRSVLDIPNDGEGTASAVTCRREAPDGRLLEEILPEGNQIVYVYDGAGRLRAVDKGFGLWPTGSWAAPCGGRSVAPSGMRRMLEIEYGVGGVPKATMRDGIRLDVLVDGFGRVIEAKDALGRRRRAGYDAHDRIVWEAVLSGDTPYVKPSPGDPELGALVEYEYDRLGRHTAVIRWHLETGRAVQRTTEYRDAERVIVVSEGGRSWTTRFDGAGRIVSETLPDGTMISTAWSGDVATRTTTVGGRVVVERLHLDHAGEVGRVEDGEGIVLLAEERDLDGRTTSRTVGELGSRLFAYDALGRLRRETQQVGGGAAPYRVEYEWDRNGRLVRHVDDRGGATRWIYDGIDRTMEVWDAKGLLRSTEYYGDSSRPTYSRERSGTERWWKFDDAGQLRYEWTQPGPGLHPARTSGVFGYDARGVLSEASIYRSDGSSWTTLLGHDSLGRRVREENSTVPVVKHEHDLYDRWTTTTVRERTMVHAFDPQDRLARVSLDGTDLAVLRHEGLGDAVGINYGDGSRATIKYDARGRFTSKEVTQFEKPIFSFSQGVGVDGLPRLRRQRLGAAPENASVFAVDGDGRLLQENSGLEIPSLGGDLTNASVVQWLQAGVAWRRYDLDGLANWRTRSDGQGKIVQPGVGPLNEYVAFEAMVEHDSDDNVRQIVEDGVTESYVYDASRRPVSATRGSAQIDVLYDALGRRVREVDNLGRSTWFAWDGWRIVATGPDLASLDEWVLHVPGEDLDDHVASVGNFGKEPRRFLHHAPDGSTMAVTDQGGLVEGYEYTAFGEVAIRAPDGTTRAASSVGNRFLFQGQLHEPATGTYWMRSRTYRPRWGRFLSRDPIELLGGPNQYAFVGGNPLGYQDPLGLDREVIDGREFLPGTRIGGGDAPRREPFFVGAAREWANPNSTVGIGSEIPLPLVGSWSAWVHYGAKGYLAQRDRDREAYFTNGLLSALGGISFVAELFSFGCGPVVGVCAEGTAAGRIAITKIVTANVKQATTTGTMVVNGRTGAQPRLRQLAGDPKLGSAEKGWIKQEMNAIDRGTTDKIRNPPGTELAHTRGREAAKGYNHLDSPSQLQGKDLHRLQHKHDNFGRRNKERP